ncbi:MAG: hypothetical protein ACK4TD_24860, partial [Ectopseudomonas guguanensis]
MAAYYNEIDAYAAQTLRNLIAAGLIAPGDVDERSIEDVHPDDLKPYTQCHFFAGIGIWSLAMRRAGWPDDFPGWTGSCPCQPYSKAGKGEGRREHRRLCDQPCGGWEGMSTNNYIAKLKLRLDRAIIQREHWKQLAENRNSIVVTEICPESRSVEEYIIDADSV